MCKSMLNYLYVHNFGVFVQQLHVQCFVQGVAPGPWDLQGTKRKPLSLWILCSSCRGRVWVETHG